MTKQINLFAITGGPGAGKTTIIVELKKMGYNCIDEVAREIIKEQVEVDDDALPWANKEKFTSLMLDRSIENFIFNKDNHEITFFDRGITDTLAYASLIELETFAQLSDKVKKYRYNAVAFILPPWKEIYKTDMERKQSFPEAVYIYEVIKKIYKSFDYQLIEVPKLETKARVDFILSVIEKLNL